MTPVSSHTQLISRKGLERNWCTLGRQQKPRSEKIFSGSSTTDQKHPTSPRFRNCLKFCLKDRSRMEQRQPHRDFNAELTEGRLKELASKWFIETQVPLVVDNGFFPAWFLGFITRKGAEEILKEKELGCFLVRLSEKAIGYILSYKGRDRCRHFVINQSENGQFVVCGDNEGHDTVPDLINYYKTSPIEPFGEYLTSSCFELMNEELYDTIQISPKEKPVAKVKAVKNLALEQPRTESPKSNRTLQEVPPLPQRSRRFDSAPLNDQDRVLYAHLRKQLPREIPRSQPIFQGNLPERSTAQDQNISRCSPPSGPGTQVYSELSLLESSESRFLSFLDKSSDREHYYRLSPVAHTLQRLSPKPTRQAPSCVPQLEKTDLCGTQRSPHYRGESAVYHLAGKPGSPRTTPRETRSLTPEQHSDSVYTEVPNEASFSCFSRDNTYELIPSNEEPAQPQPKSNTYELLEDVRPKVLKNEKWKWLFPEAKRKW